MSRSRKAVAALLVPVAAGALALLGAGTASAAKPYSGNGYVGVEFDPNETRFIADVNAGGVVDAIPHKFWRVRLADGSIYANPQNIVYANIDQLVDETAAHGGQVSFTVSDPAIWGSNISILQKW